VEWQRTYFPRIQTAAHVAFATWIIPCGGI
jgi:hypothetical protein